MAEYQACSGLHASKGSLRTLALPGRDSAALFPVLSLGAGQKQAQLPDGTLTVILPLMSALMGVNTGDPRQSGNRMRRKKLHFQPKWHSGHHRLNVKGPGRTIYSCSEGCVAK